MIDALTANYLATQIEWGGDELTLEEPWGFSGDLISIPSKLNSTDINRDLQTRNTVSTSTIHPQKSRDIGISNAQSPPGTESWFQEMAQQLSGKNVVSLSPKGSETARELPKDSAILPPQIEIPIFADIHSLNKELKTLFEKETVKKNKLCLGQGLPGNRLAVVALRPMVPSPDTLENQPLLPLVRDAGDLLDKMLRAIHLDRGMLFETVLLKISDPTALRVRVTDKVRWQPWLIQELKLVEAPAVLLLGEDIAQSVLHTGKKLEDLRRKWHLVNGLRFVVTHHPQELLNDESLKRPAWEDLKWLRDQLGQEARS